MENHPEFNIESKFYIIVLFRYTGFLLIIIINSLCQGRITKDKNGNRKKRGTRKKLQPTQTARPSKRGRKSNKQTLENIANIYDSETPMHIRKTIQGWQRQSDDDDGDLKEQEARMDFISDRGNTSGKFSLFQQLVKTYWKFKCVLAKAMLSMQEKEANPLLLFELQQIEQDMREMAKAQIQANA